MNINISMEYVMATLGQVVVIALGVSGGMAIFRWIIA